MNEDKIALSEKEYEVLKAIVDMNVKRAELRELSQRTNVPLSTLASITRLLAEKGLLIIEEREKSKYELTEKGLEALKRGLPEERLLSLLASNPILSISDIKKILMNETNIAIGQAKRKGFIEVKDGKVILKVDVSNALKEISKLSEALKLIAEGRGLSSEILLRELKERGLVKISKIKTTYVQIKGEPKELLSKVTVEISRLTHEVLKNRRWKEFSLRPYNIKSEPPRILPARKHFLIEFIEVIRDIMKEMGFKEVDGPMIEVELFNFDVLFQPQDHPAREIHDTLWIEEPSMANLSSWRNIVEKAKEVHETSWGYSWDPLRSARIVLRSQTTAVSARVLSMKPKPPLRYFTIGKVFRADTVDSSHLSDFHQLDGIESWEGYTFKDLLSTLKEIAERLGLSIKFKPAYFPFTEPSVEGYVKLPNGRWLELFGAGLFRPEVLKILGIDYPVGAWGFGIERLAAAYYGINDIRILYSKDYDFIRSFPLKV